MSLKAFHIIFITLSVALCLLFGVYAGYQALTQSSLLMVLAGLVSIGCGVGLVFYGTRFLRKLKSEGIS